MAILHALPRSSTRFLLLALAAGATACGGSGDAREAGRATDSAAGVSATPVTPAPTGNTGADPAGTAGGPVPAAAAGSADEAADSLAAAGATKPDSAVRGTLIAGRSKQDQRTFNDAIRVGTKALASWPKHAAAPGALLPGKRIIAYYGNPNSKKMGVIGEYPEPQMLQKWDATVNEWKRADPSTPVVPAIHLVAIVAQGAPGADGKWRRREGAAMIEKTYNWAKSRNGILFVDIQTGWSTVREELPYLLPYLARPDVHLGLDPEFHMQHAKKGVRPSAKIGQMMASDVNWVIGQLDRLVTEKKIPPKVLVVHRFQKSMLPDAENIRPTKNVQVVIHMDGWGPPWLKFDSYNHYVVSHPVQYTGFKLFYHNDTKAGHPLLTPKELLQLRPVLSYIQYQ